jgi:hypothetical protein
MLMIFIYLLTCFSFASASLNDQLVNAGYQKASTTQNATIWTVNSFGEISAIYTVGNEKEDSSSGSALIYSNLIYSVGSQSENMVPKATLWITDIEKKITTPFSLSYLPGYSNASYMTRNKGILYITGTQTLGGISKGCLWIVDLSGKIFNTVFFEENSFPSSAVFDRDFIYVAGTIYSPFGKATLWIVDKKSFSPTTKSISNSISDCFSLAIYLDSLYFVGDQLNGGIFSATVWRTDFRGDLVETEPLSNINEDSLANSIVLDHQGIYICGYQKINGLSNATLWVKNKNGITPLIVGNKAQRSNAYSISKKKSHIYLSGNQYDGVIDNAALWIVDPSIKLLSSNFLGNQMFGSICFFVFSKPEPRFNQNHRPVRYLKGITSFYEN